MNIVMGMHKCIMMQHVRKLIFSRPSTTIGCFIVKPEMVFNSSDDETPKEFITFRLGTVPSPGPSARSRRCVITHDKSDSGIQEQL